MGEKEIHILFSQVKGLQSQHDKYVARKVGTFDAGALNVQLG